MGFEVEPDKVVVDRSLSRCQRTLSYDLWRDDCTAQPPIGREFMNARLNAGEGPSYLSPYSASTAEPTVTVLSKWLRRWA